MGDGARMYPKVGREFASWSSVDHAAGEYVRMGFHHSNTVENYFSILKLGITGTFHHVSASDKLSVMAHPKIQEMIDLAARDIKRLNRASSCASARRAWVDFLDHSNKAINRLEGYSRRTKQVEKYKKLLNEEIWASNLTKYMRIARNADHHGVDDLDVDDPHNERVVFSDGSIMGSVTVIGQNEAGKQFVMPPSAPMEFASNDPGARRVALKPTVRMVPMVSKKGDTVMPPHVGDLLAEDEPEVAAVARTYLAWVVEKIATFD